MTRPNGRTGKGKKKSPACVSRRWDHILYASKTVSRVLYSTVIYLDVLLPARSSHLWEAAGPACCFHHGVAPDRVYSDGRFRAVGCALTAPFHPYRTGRPTRRYISVALFLKSPLCCTFPEVAFGGRYPLSLPCGARTFLMDGLSAWPRDCLFSSRCLLYRKPRPLSTEENFPAAL